jgi:hypothetical protein
MSFEVVPSSKKIPTRGIYFSDVHIVDPLKPATGLVTKPGSWIVVFLLYQCRVQSSALKGPVEPSVSVFWLNQQFSSVSLRGCFSARLF